MGWKRNVFICGEMILAEDVEFESLKGKVLKSIKVLNEEDAFVFTSNDGDRYVMYHDQECSERVWIEDVCGDIKCLLETPITMAELVTESGEVDYEYCTWSFYKLATVKGYVTIRWCGTSNGHYSEEAVFVKELEKED